MNLPKKCPECSVNLENEASYYALGIQYCNGMVTDINDDGTVALDDLKGGDWSIDPYEIQCSECGYVLWERALIVNKEKFFVEEKK